MPSGCIPLWRTYDRLLVLHHAGAAVALQFDSSLTKQGRLLVLVQLIEESMSGPAAEAWLSLVCPHLASDSRDAQSPACGPAKP